MRSHESQLFEQLEEKPSYNKYNNKNSNVVDLKE